MFLRKRAAVVPLLAMAAAFSCPRSARSADVAGSASLGVSSKYVWRGIIFTDGPVLQPGASAEVSGFTLGIWGNMDLDDVNSQSGKFNEVDYTVDYNFPVGDKASVSVGAILYDFPNTTSAATTELYAKVGFGVPGDPSVTIYKDVDEAKGLYVSFGGGYGVPLGGERTLDLGLSVGFGDSDHNAFYYTVAGSALTDVLFTVGSTFELSGGKVSVTPSLAIPALIDGGIADAFELAGKDTSSVVFGVSVSCKF